MPRVIPDDGPLAARIVVVGEMDASQEEAQGRHFVGLAGQEWNRWLAHAGLRRQDIRVTNVVPYRAHPSNKIAAVGHDELERNILALHERLAALTAPIVLVPMGNVALRALTGKTGITKWRGSILSYTDLRGRQIKVIPTLHPASLLYRKGETAAMYGASSGAETGWLKRCHLDWQRVAADSKFPELRLPQRTRHIEPTWHDVCDYVEDARQRAEILVLDIETPHGVEVVPGRVLKNGTQQWKRVKGARRMTVFGASHEPSLGIAIPTTKEYWADRGVDVQDVFAKIRELCALPGVTLGGQSGAGFDRVWLHWYGVETPRYVWDTRWLSHSHDPLDDHALAYQASTLTREPYWKDDGRESDTETEATFDWKRYQEYNCTDSTVTRELVDVWLGHADLPAYLRNVPLDPERVAFYLRRYAALFDPMLSMSTGGIRMAESRRLRAATRFLAEAVTIREKLALQAGFELTGDKGSLSSKKLQAFLYQKLRLPERRDRKTHALSTNEVTVRKLMLTPQGKRVLGTDSKADAERPGPLILRHRRLEALQRFTKEGIADADSYARSQVGFTYTLRFAMGASPRGTGNNNQNTDRELLGLYVPDDGHIFLETDLSQAEDRVVKVLSAACTDDPARREELLTRARAKPWENDEHWRAAELIFGKPRAALDKELHRNQVGKRSRHAGNYGMRGGTMAEQCLKAGYVFTDAECDGFISTLLDQDTPEVKLWQAWVRKLIMREKRLTTSWGHTVNVEYEALDDNLYRKMYALEPQNSVTGIIKYWGLVPLYKWFNDPHETRFGSLWVDRPPRIVNEKHDSLLISCAPENVYEIMVFLKTKLERERTYRGIPLTIWTEFKLGKTAAMSVEFKKFPARDDVEAAVRTLT